jgi:hypothetical protein
MAVLKEVLKYKTIYCLHLVLIGGKECLRPICLSL